MSDLVGNPEYEGTNDLVSLSSKELLNNQQENLETNKFPRVSLEQIPDVISEMVEITSKNIEEENVKNIEEENVDINSPSQATVTESQENSCSAEKESNQIDNQIPEKELPERRRSNRIRRLVVKPDGFVKRCSGTKKTKDNKSTDKVINLQLIPTPPSTDTENIKNDGDEMSFSSDANSSSKTSGICSKDEQLEDVELQNISKKTQVGKINKKSVAGIGRKLKSEAKKSTFSKKKSDKSISEASEKITSKEKSEVAASLNTNSSAENSDEKCSSLPRNVSEKKTKSEVKKITSRRKRLDKNSSENPSIETTCKEEVAKTSDSDNNNSESTGITKETVPEVKTEKKVRSQTKKNNSRRKKQDASTSENAPDEAVSKDDISKSVDSDNCSAEIVEEKHFSSPQTLATSCAKVLDSSEIKVPEAISTFAKNILDPNSEIIENSNVKPVKVKSRWWRSSELEGVLNSDSLISPNDQTVAASNVMQESPNNPENESESAGVNEEAENIQMDVQEPSVADDSIKDDNTTKQLNYPVYCHIEENIYRFARKKSKSKKQVRRMVCDCTLTKEEQEYGVLGCKQECLNRLLMIECGSRCPIGEACSNKKFQKKQYVKAEIFHAEKKGWGLRTLEDISVGDFLMEFVGEVLNHKEYRQRVKHYAKEKNVHSYFMALKTDEILDATSKGNLTRFINHSCDPNCETQKWTVNGELRVGVFAKRSMSAGEELTLDYQFQRYGREAQKCYCGSDNCSGYIGGAKQISIDAYGANKSGTSRRKKGSDDKKREWEDLT
ncbi:probable histone-lysine N-methyltransferase CG1716, partial [Stegodyphus dumicola]|uniref:probable histone-lysine N-methyltransferase CG1716 n=1 Tax=Stegodyphus dumicola TaxID=202533 RepID=UPI0015A7F3B7